MSKLVRKDFDNNFTIYSVNDGKKEKWGETVWYRHPLNENDTFYVMFGRNGRLQNMVHMNPSYTYNRPNTIEEAVDKLSKYYLKKH